MPVLPGAQQRLIPDAASSVAQYRGGIVESAQAEQGQVMSQIGSEIVQMADKRKAELDQLRVIEAATELRNDGTKLEYDEKEGYRTVKNGAVVEQGIVKKYTTKYKEVADSIAASLTPRQQEMFASHVAASAANFQAGIMRYSVEETEKYGGEVFVKALKSHEGAAIAARLDDRQIANQIKGVKALTTSRMDHLGIVDTPTREETMKGAVGGVHAALIAASINARDTARANEYFNRPNVRAEMTQEQIARIEEMVKPATDFALAKKNADLVWQEAKANPTLNVAQRLAELSSGNPKVASESHTLVAQYQHAQRMADQENLGSVLLAFEKGGTNAATLAAIRSTPEFLALPAGDQAKFLEHARQVQHQALVEYRTETRFARAEERQAAQEAKIAQQERWNANLPKAGELIDNPAVLGGMSNQQLAALSMDFSPQTMTLLRHKRDEIIKGISKHEVDKEMFNAAVTNLSKPQQATVKALAEVDIAIQQKSLGRPLSPTEHAATYRKIIDEVTPKAETFTGRGESPLYKMPEEKAMFFHALQSNFTDKTKYNQAWMEEMYGDQQKDVAKRAATLEILQRAQSRGQQLSLPQLESAVARRMSVATPAAPAATAPAATAPAATAPAATAPATTAPTATAPTATAPATTAPAQVESTAKPVTELEMEALDTAVAKAVAKPLPVPTAKGGDTAFAEKGFLAQKGKMTLPVQGRVVSTFSPAHTVKDAGGTGSTPTKGGRRIFTNEGEPIKAVADGTVVYAGYLRGYDDVVIVKHPGDYLTVYKNGKDLEVKEGDRILKGSPLGKTIGREFNFEIRHKDVLQDPSTWFKKAGK